jgi:putative tryptophan/tyrosine transport system substrate-binding protein
MSGREFLVGIVGATEWAAVYRCAAPDATDGNFVTTRSVEAPAYAVTALRTGPQRDWLIEVDYNWLDGRFDRLPALMADLVRRQVAVIATPDNTLVTATAKAHGDDPDRFQRGRDGGHTSRQVHNS